MSLQRLPETSLADGVAVQLRDAIQSGAYAPGDRLVERRIAAELGVSHIPVREALARLVDEGLVERVPRRGCRVAQLDVEQVRNVTGLRVVLEQYVVERAQERWNDGDEQELRKVVEQMRAAASRGARSRMFDLDIRFHERLWQLADDPILHDIVAGLRGRISGFLRAANAALPDEALAAHADAHEELLDAIASRDRERGRSAMAGHIAESTDRVLDQLEQQEKGTEG